MASSDLRPPVSGVTRLAAVIGDPVRHSMSPTIHNAAFAELGLDWTYLALPVPSGRGGDAVEAMRLFGIDGLSVTMPHKDTVAQAVDARTSAVERLGACNCVFRDGDRLVGDNTDGDGWVRAFELDSGLGLADARVAVIGAGGAARAIVEAVGRAGASEIVVVNRTTASAERAAALAEVARIGTVDDLADVDVVVNATSIGMAGGPDAEGIPLSGSWIGQHHVVADIVYQPRSTPLLQEAARRGARTVGGLGMLVHQAATAFERWTNHTAPIDTMTAAVLGAIPPDD